MRDRSIQKPEHGLQNGSALCSTQHELRTAPGSHRLGRKLWAQSWQGVGQRLHSTQLSSLTPSLSHPLGCQLWLVGFQTPLAPGLPSSHRFQCAPRPMPAGPAGQGPSVGVPLVPFRVSSAPSLCIPPLMRGKREGGREGNYIHTRTCRN